MTIARAMTMTMALALASARTMKDNGDGDSDDGGGGDHKNQIVQTFGLFTEGRYVTLDTCFAMPWDSVLRPGVRQMINSDKCV